MSAADVHFEVFVRRYPDSSWTLKTATDVRLTALEEAKELIDKGSVAAARVMRETLDPATGEFHSLTILSLGVPERPRKVKAPEPTEPLCVSPQDLYTCHARERIGRYGWIPTTPKTELAGFRVPGFQIAADIHRIAADTDDHMVLHNQGC